MILPDPAGVMGFLRSLFVMSLPRLLRLLFGAPPPRQRPQHRRKTVAHSTRVTRVERTSSGTTATTVVRTTQTHSATPEGPPFPASMKLQGKAWVIDGDTIAIGRIKIRLAGIDAPEIDEPYGKNSKWAMVNICKGQIITAHLNGERSYDRLVGTCTLPDGRDIAALLVAQGLALDWPFYSGGKYRHLEPEGVRKRMWRVARNCTANPPPETTTISAG